MESQCNSAFEAPMERTQGHFWPQTPRMQGPPGVIWCRAQADKEGFALPSVMGVTSAPFGS